MADGTEAGQFVRKSLNLAVRSVRLKGAFTTSQTATRLGGPASRVTRDCRVCVARTGLVEREAFSGSNGEGRWSGPPFVVDSLH